MQKPKAFLRPIITNLGNECIDPNISAENRQRSVEWITTTTINMIIIMMPKVGNHDPRSWPRPVAAVPRGAVGASSFENRVC